MDDGSVDRAGKSDDGDLNFATCMKKGSLVSDTFEQLAELGQSTAQKAGQTVKTLTAGTVKKAVEAAAVGGSSDKQQLSLSEKGKKERANYTPLDKNSLEKQYQTQDESQINTVRQRLYQFLERQKQEEKKVIEGRKQEELERKKTIEKEEARKKKQQEEAKKQTVPLPKGKERRSIFSPKTIAKRSQVETRAGSGKQ